MALFQRDLGIDLGTMFTRIIEGGQMILEEPTVVAVDIEELKMVAVGHEALNMMGRVSQDAIQVTRPLQSGVVAYYELTERLLEFQVKKISGPLGGFRPKNLTRIMITHPYGITSVERRAVHEAALQVGDAFMLPTPLAAAIGVDLPIGTPSGNMIVCMGGGCTQAAVMAMNDIVSGETLRQGGLQLDEAIASYVRKKYGLIIGQPTAEQIKLSIGAAVPQDEEKSLDLQGQDQVSGLPRAFTFTTGEVVEAVQPALEAVFETIRQVLEKTPPELASDIIDRGIALCGGAALLRGMDKLMTQKLGVPTYLVDNPITCMGEGAERGLEMLPILRRNVPQL
ncbi:MAG: rod shape-determining protein [Chloroflexi bacterium]|nr:MAG: rod shape-determining protein [Chloroflexota bacterium]MBL1194446.1 rod shape-determining protein [Chloroflexota bacterium]NOH11734.1 rod shape-determining protein [Chloroflexota bacterium]